MLSRQVKNQSLHHWRVKLNRFGDWIEYPGEHTAEAIWRLKWQGFVASAEPIEDSEPAESASNRE